MLFNKTINISNKKTVVLYIVIYYEEIIFFTIKHPFLDMGAAKCYGNKNLSLINGSTPGGNMPDKKRINPDKRKGKNRRSGQERRSEEDRRKTIIQLTEKTRKLQSTYIKLSADMTKIFYKGFTSEEIDELEAYLHRILKNLVSQESD